MSCQPDTEGEEDSILQKPDGTVKAVPQLDVHSQGNLRPPFVTVIDIFSPHSEQL